MYRKLQPFTANLWKFIMKSLVKESSRFMNQNVLHLTQDGMRKIVENSNFRRSSLSAQYWSIEEFKCYYKASHLQDERKLA